MDGMGRTAQRNVETTVTGVIGLLVAVRLAVSRAGKGAFVIKVSVLFDITTRVMNYYHQLCQCSRLNIK